MSHYSHLGSRKAKAFPATGTCPLLRRQPTVYKKDKLFVLESFRSHGKPVMHIRVDTPMQCLVHDLVDAVS